MCNNELECAYCLAFEASNADNPLSKASFKKNLQTIFPAFYLTLVGVIQSSSLALLIAKNENLFMNGYFSCDCVVYFVLTFIVLCFVALEYVTFTICFSWSPTIVDIITPFAIGVFESFLAFRFNDGAVDVYGWWNYMIFILILAVFSYAHAFERLKKFKDDKVAEIFELHKRAFDCSIYISLSSIVVILVSILFYSSILMYVVAVVIFALHMWKEHSWFRKVHNEYKIPYL